MRRPLRSWKNLLGKLGMRMSEKPRSSASRSRLTTQPRGFESLEARTVMTVNAGELDLTFGNGAGWIRTDSGNVIMEQVAAIKTLPDGGILAAGTGKTDEGGNYVDDYVVAKYLQNGNLDTNFGNGGVVILMNAGPDRLYGMDVDSSGNIWLVGSGDVDGDTVSDAKIVRLNSWGALDTSFDTDGIKQLDFGGTEEWLATIQIVGSGENTKVYVGATTYQSGTGFDFGVARLDYAGNLDTAFGTGGISVKTTTTPGGYTEYVNWMAVDATGGVYLSGFTYNTTSTALIRFDASGVFDTTFGIVYGAGGSILLDSTGGILVAGGTHDSVTGDYYARIGRYNATTGTLDTTFGDSGFGYISLDSNVEYIADLAVDPQGRIVFTGTYGYDGNSKYGVMAGRMNDDGTMDVSFGSDGTGLFTQDLGLYGDDQATAVTIRPDGRILLGGYVRDNYWHEFAIMRLLGDAPTAMITGSTNVVEAAPYTLGLQATGFGTSTSPTQWEVDWGDGTVNTFYGNPNSAIHYFYDESSQSGYAVKARWSMDGFTSDWSEELVVAVIDKAPTLQLRGPGMINEGVSYQLELIKTSYGNDPIVSWEIDWGDGTTETLPYDTSSVYHSFDNGPATRVITAIATDSNGLQHLPVNQLTVFVQNARPVVYVSAWDTAYEGQNYSINLSATTPANDPIEEWVIDWGDGTTVDTIVGSTAYATHVYADGTISREIRISARDQDGMYANIATKQILVMDVAPSVSISGNGYVEEGTEYAVQLNYSDVAADPVNSWTVNWGDGNSSVIAGSITTASHRYADDFPGRQVTVSVMMREGKFDLSSPHTVYVQNAAPTLSLEVQGNAIGTGEGYYLKPKVVDPGRDSIISWSIDWGDSTYSVHQGMPEFIGHIYTTAGSYGITATAIDEDGGPYSVYGTIYVTVTDNGLTTAEANPQLFPWNGFQWPATPSRDGSPARPQPGEFPAGPIFTGNTPSWPIDYGVVYSAHQDYDTAIYDAQTTFNTEELAARQTLGSATTAANELYQSKFDTANTALQNAYQESTNPNPNDTAAAETAFQAAVTAAMQTRDDARSSAYNTWTSSDATANNAWTAYSNPIATSIFQGGDATWPLKLQYFTAIRDEQIAHEVKLAKNKYDYELAYQAADHAYEIALTTAREVQARVQIEHTAWEEKNRPYDNAQYYVKGAGDAYKTYQFAIADAEEEQSKSIADAQKAYDDRVAELKYDLETAKNDALAARDSTIATAEKDAALSMVNGTETPWVRYQATLTAAQVDRKLAEIDTEQTRANEFATATKTADLAASLRKKNATREDAEEKRATTKESWTSANTLQKAIAEAKRSAAADQVGYETTRATAVADAQKEFQKAISLAEKRRLIGAMRVDEPGQTYGDEIGTQVGYIELEIVRNIEGIYRYVNGVNGDAASALTTRQNSMLNRRNSEAYTTADEIRNKAIAEAGLAYQIKVNDRSYELTKAQGDANAAARETEAKNIATQDEKKLKRSLADQESEAKIASDLGLAKSQANRDAAESLADAARDYEIANANAEQTFNANVFEEYLDSLAQITSWEEYVYALTSARRTQVLAENSAIVSHRTAVANALYENTVAYATADLTYYQAESTAAKAKASAIKDGLLANAAATKTSRHTQLASQKSADVAYATTLADAYRDLSNAEVDATKAFNLTVYSAEKAYALKIAEATYESNIGHETTAASLRSAAEAAERTTLLQNESTRALANATARVTWTSDIADASVTFVAAVGSANNALAQAQAEAMKTSAQAAAQADYDYVAAIADLDKDFQNATAGDDESYDRAIALANYQRSMAFADSGAEYKVDSATADQVYKAAVAQEYVVTITNWALLQGTDHANFLKSLAIADSTRITTSGPVILQRISAEAAAEKLNAQDEAGAELDLSYAQALQDRLYSDGIAPADAAYIKEIARLTRVDAIAQAEAHADRSKTLAEIQTTYNNAIATLTKTYANAAAVAGKDWIVNMNAARDIGSTAVGYVRIGYTDYRAYVGSFFSPVSKAYAEYDRLAAEFTANTARVVSINTAEKTRVEALADADKTFSTAINNAIYDNISGSEEAGLTFAGVERDASIAYDHAMHAAEKTAGDAQTDSSVVLTQSLNTAATTFVQSIGAPEIVYASAVATAEVTYLVAEAVANIDNYPTAFEQNYATRYSEWLAQSQIYYVAYMVGVATNANAAAIAARQYDQTLSNAQAATGAIASKAITTARVAAEDARSDAYAHDSYSRAEIEKTRALAIASAEKTKNNALATAVKTEQVARVEADNVKRTNATAAFQERDLNYAQYEIDWEAAKFLYDPYTEERDIAYEEYEENRYVNYVIYNDTIADVTYTHKWTLADIVVTLRTTERDAKVTQAETIGQAESAAMTGRSGAQKTLTQTLANVDYTETTTISNAQRSGGVTSAGDQYTHDSNLAASTEFFTIAQADLTIGFLQNLTAIQAAVWAAVVEPAEVGTLAPDWFFSQRANYLYSWTISGQSVAYHAFAANVAATQRTAETEAAYLTKQFYTNQANAAADLTNSLALKQKNAVLDIAAKEDQQKQALAPTIVEYQKEHARLNAEGEISYAKSDRTYIEEKEQGNWADYAKYIRDEQIANELEASIKVLSIAKATAEYNAIEGKAVEISSLIKSVSLAMNEEIRDYELASHSEIKVVADELTNLKTERDLAMATSRRDFGVEQAESLADGYVVGNPANPLEVTQNEYYDDSATEEIASAESNFDETTSDIEEDQDEALVDSESAEQTAEDETGDRHDAATGLIEAQERGALDELTKLSNGAAQGQMPSGYVPAEQSAKIDAAAFYAPNYTADGVLLPTRDAYFANNTNFLFQVTTVITGRPLSENAYTIDQRIADMDQAARQAKAQNVSTPKAPWYSRAWDSLGTSGGVAGAFFGTLAKGVINLGIGAVVGVWNMGKHLVTGTMDMVYGTFQIAEYLITGKIRTPNVTFNPVSKALASGDMTLSQYYQEHATDMVLSAATLGGWDHAKNTKEYLEGKKTVDQYQRDAGFMGAMAVMGSRGMKKTPISKTSLPKQLGKHLLEEVKDGTGYNLSKSAAKNLKTNLMGDSNPKSAFAGPDNATKAADDQAQHRQKVETEVADPKKYRFDFTQDYCFAAGTPILTELGHITIENLKVGDYVLARHESDPAGKVRPQRVGKIHRLSTEIVEVHVGGQIIRSTQQHPFYVDGKGWTPTRDLLPGDQLVGHNKRLTTVDRIVITESNEAVFNLRVEEDHTFFIGQHDWEWSAWVHNTYTVEPIGNGKHGIRKPDGGWAIEEVPGSPGQFRRIEELNPADAHKKAADFEAKAKKAGNVSEQASPKNGSVRIEQDALDFAARSKNEMRKLEKLKETGNNLADNGYEVRVLGESPTQPGDIAIKGPGQSVEVNAQSKLLGAGTSNAVQANLAKGSSQAGAGGVTVMDGKSAGLTFEEFDAGYNSFLRTSTGRSGTVIAILRDGSIVIRHFPG